MAETIHPHVTLEFFSANRHFVDRLPIALSQPKILSIISRKILGLRRTLGKIAFPPRFLSGSQRLPARVEVKCLMIIYLVSVGLSFDSFSRPIR